MPSAPRPGGVATATIVSAAPGDADAGAPSALIAARATLDRRDLVRRSELAEIVERAVCGTSLRTVGLRVCSRVSSSDSPGSMMRTAARR